MEAAGQSLLAPAMGMLGFAIALALPFALFALFPQWMQNLPKSGAWMQSFKVTLAFIELALSLKFLSVADMAYGWGILPRWLFIALWIACFVGLGIYLIRKSWVGKAVAVICWAFALYLLPGLWGASVRAIAAFAPPVEVKGRKVYYDYEEGLAYARQVNKPVMVNFTGYGCVNCRKMEASVWTDERVSQLMTEEYVLVTLYVDDKTPLTSPQTVVENGRERKLRTIGDKWSHLQRTMFGANAQPFYVLLDNDGNPLVAPYSFDEDIDHYVDFLQSGLSEYRKQ